MHSPMLRPITIGPALAAACALAVAQTVSTWGGTAEERGTGPAASANGGSSGAAGTAFRAHAGPESDPRPETTATLFREGTRIRDHRGRFEPAGDAADFIDDSGMRFGGLKNLNMQRVAQVLRSSRAPDDLEWTVSGIVTEFGGRNYLLITRVVRRSSSKPAAVDAAHSDPPLRLDPATVDIATERNTMNRSD